MKGEENAIDRLGLFQFPEQPARQDLERIDGQQAARHGFGEEGEAQLPAEIPPCLGYPAGSRSHADELVCVEAFRVGIAKMAEPGRQPAEAVVLRADSTGEDLERTGCRHGLSFPSSV
nr:MULTISPECIES: hypothetical protein [unclassified Sphingomonas]